MPKRDTGTVDAFYSKRGFGFIAPANGSEKVFVHWEQIQTDDRWPKLEKGQKVQYSIETGDDGRAKATNVTKPGGGKLSVTADTREFGDFRYPGTVKWFRGYDGFGFITLGMDAAVGSDTIAEGEDVYVSREEIMAENPNNPKIAKGMDVEFLVCKRDDGKFAAAEVTLPNGVPIGDLPERDPSSTPRPKTKGKGKGKGSTKGGKASKGRKGASKATPVVKKTIAKPVAVVKKTPAKGKAKGKGKGRRY